MIWFNSGIWCECRNEFFDPGYWQRIRAVVGHSYGRGETLYFAHQGEDFVLRHYRRGGMVGKLNDDRYLFLGRQNSRCWREYNLLSKLSELGLPAPVAVGARLVREGFWYRADLITKRIADAEDLSRLLKKQRLSQPRWRQVGEVIARFHLAGVYHADLNCHNIMLSESQAWLIDFDKGELRRPRRDWQAANLSRLRRSLGKEQRLQSHFYWLDSDWDALLDGYRSLIP